MAPLHFMVLVCLAVAAATQTCTQPVEEVVLRVQPGYPTLNESGWLHVHGNTNLGCNTTVEHLRVTGDFVSATGAGTVGDIMVAQDTSGEANWANINTVPGLACVIGPASAGTTPDEIVSCGNSGLVGAEMTEWPTGTTLQRLVLMGISDANIDSVGNNANVKNTFLGATESINIKSAKLRQVGALATTQFYLPSVNNASYTNVGAMASFAMRLFSPATGQMSQVMVAASLETLMSSGRAVGGRIQNVLVAASYDTAIFTSGSTNADDFINIALVATIRSEINDGGDTLVALIISQAFIAACDTCMIGKVTPGTYSNIAVIGGTNLNGDACGNNSLTTNNLCVNDITINDGANVVLDTTTGTQIGTAATQKLGLWGKTPIVQPAASGSTAGYTYGVGTPMLGDTCSTGGAGMGTKCYTLADVVLALKSMGVLAQN